MRAWIVATAAILTVIGISSPRVAGRSGHLLLVAIGLIVAVVAAQPVFAAIEQRGAEAFIPNPPRVPRATMPNQMAEIVDAFTKRAETRTSGTDGEVPTTLLRRIGSAAKGRLADHHHLHLDDAADHDRIRSLVSPQLWALLRPARVGTAPEAPPAVGFDELGPLLDEVEAL
jgi:hypothetical protein